MIVATAMAGVIVPLLPGDSPPDLGMATILAMFSLEG